MKLKGTYKLFINRYYLLSKYPVSYTHLDVYKRQDIIRLTVIEKSNLIIMGQA